MAVVYLPLNPNKVPDETNWEKEEKIFINEKLICLSAFNRTETDLYKGWLKHCIDECENEDAKSILKQYSKLILKIGGFIMDKKLHSEFYKKVISQPEFFNTAQSIKYFLENLPNYRVRKIYDTYIKNLSPFEEITLQKEDELSFERYKNGSRSFKIYLNCLEDKYELKFFDEKYDEIYHEEQVNNRYTSELIKRLKNTKFDEERLDEYVKWFDFPIEEKKLYDFIDCFITELKSLSEIIID